MQRQNYQKFTYTSFWMEDDQDILFWDYSKNLEIDISVAKKLVEDRLNYTHGRSVYGLIDATNIKSTTKQAREFMSDPHGGLKGILGGAFISSNMFTTVIINLFLRITKPIVPAKFFTSKEEAITWLKKVKSEREILC
jgi:hypothetical protein